MKTRQIMLDAVKNLLQKYDIDNITVQDIIDEAGVARTTFYKYFQDKYDIVNAYFQNNITKEMMYKYDGTNIDEIILKIYEFVYKNKKYFKNAIKSDATGSFCDFFYNFTVESYIHMCKEILKTDILTEETKFKIEVVSHQGVYCLKKWVDEDCVVPISKLLKWTKDILIDVYSICESEQK